MQDDLLLCETLSKYEGEKRKLQAQLHELKTRLDSQDRALFSAHSALNSARKVCTWGHVPFDCQL